MVENTTDPKQANTFQKCITNSHFVYIHTRHKCCNKIMHVYTELTQFLLLTGVHPEKLLVFVPYVDPLS